MAERPKKSSSRDPRRPSGADRRRTPQDRKQTVRGAAKAQVGRKSRRRSMSSGRYDEQDERYYELETFEEHEQYSEPELREEHPDEMLSEFSHGNNDFFVDESHEASRRRSKKKPSNPSDKRKEELKPERERKPLSPMRRKLIHILTYTAIMTVVLVVGVVLSLTVLFKTQNFDVTGTERYSAQEIEEACGISKGQNIFLAPKHAAERRIKKAFPYIEDVNVGFRIPDTIRISVDEAVEGYLVKSSDTEYLVISTKGRILNKTTNPSQYDLPKFIGPTLKSGEIGDYVSYEDDTVVEMIESITQTFADNGYQGITEIDATNMAEITFTYDNRIKVKLGIPEDLNYKIRTAMTIIDEKIDINDTGTITGILDVSRCNTTKRSYFNEGSIDPTVAPTQDPSAPTEETEGTGDDYSGDDYTGEYTWTEEGGDVWG